MLGAAIFTMTAASAMEEDAPPPSPRIQREANNEPEQDQQHTFPPQAIQPCLFQNFTALDFNNTIFPFILDGSDLVRLSRTCKDFYNVLNEIIEKKVFIIGNIGSGRSTLVYLSMGKPLVAKRSEDKLSWQFEPTENLPNIKITQGKSQGARNSSVVCDHVNKRLIIDCPGFNDPKGSYFDFEHACELYVQLQGKVSVVCVVPEEMLGIDEKFYKTDPCLMRRKPFSFLINKLTEIFPNQDELENVLSIVISKNSDDKSHKPLIPIFTKPCFLTDRGQDLLIFFETHPKRVAIFREPFQEGNYDKTKELETFMNTLEYVDNPQVSKPVWESITSQDGQGRWSSKDRCSINGTQESF